MRVGGGRRHVFLTLSSSAFGCGQNPKDRKASSAPAAFVLFPRHLARKSGPVQGGHGYWSSRRATSTDSTPGGLSLLPRRLHGGASRATGAFGSQISPRRSQGQRGGVQPGLRLLTALPCRRPSAQLARSSGSIAQKVTAAFKCSRGGRKRGRQAARGWACPNRCPHVCPASLQAMDS